MATDRFRFLAVALLAGGLAIALPGCSTPGPIATRRNNAAMLKASVSQLEYDNQNLKKQLASVKSDSSRYETELAREQQLNGELTARLDDAKDVVRRSGGDVTALNTSTSSDISDARAGTRDVDVDEVPPPARTTPTRRSSRGSRKPPAAAIPQAKSSGASATVTPGESRPWDVVDPGPQASRDRDDPDDDGRWLPIARGPRGIGSTVTVR